MGKHAAQRKPRHRLEGSADLGEYIDGTTIRFFDWRNTTELSDPKRADRTAKRYIELREDKS